MYHVRWLVFVTSIMLAGCTSAAAASPPNIAPTTEPILGCDLAQQYVLDYRRTANAPRVWERLVTLQGGNGDGSIAPAQPAPDAAGHCAVRWVGTLNGRLGPRVQLAWWYMPITGEVQAADAGTKSTLGW